MAPTPLKVLTPYLLACLVVIAVTIGRVALNHVAGLSPIFLLYLAAVMSAAWVGGIRPGLFATALGALAGNFFLTPPSWHFGWGDDSHRFELVMFLIEGVFISVAAGVLHRAQVAAVAHKEELRTLDDALLHVTDEERRRIGHDLHDGLGQQLTGIALIVKTLYGKLKLAESPQADDAGQVVKLVNDAIAQTRSLSRGLDPVPQGPNGLADALKELCASTANAAQVRCVFEDRLIDHSMLTDAAAHLFRIAQEAVHNAIKHGQPRNIHLELQRGLDQALGDPRKPVVYETIVLSITNDGRPFDATTPSDGMGLRVMRHRASLIGGELIIENAARGGTTVSCVVRVAEGTLTRAGVL